MTVSLDHGKRSWSMDRDNDGYRTYTLKNVVSSGVLDGPLTVLFCPGLPLPGQRWNFGTDFDVWCWCHHQAKVTPLNDGEPNTEWLVEQEFSNRPVRLCGEFLQENPLLQPQKISGLLCKYTEEASYDRFLNPIVNSAWEQIRGPGVQFDVNRATVRIEQNVPQLQLALINQANNCVNAFPLWGCPARCIKLSSVTWQRNFTGICVPYYTRIFEFDINMVLDPVTLQVVSGHDRNLLDEGTKVLFGQWDSVSGDYILKKIVGVFYPDPFNPAHFIKHKDRTGENAHVILNGLGLPAGVRVRAGPSLFISWADASDHTAYDTGDTSRWLKLVTNPSNRPLWAAATWAQGSLVNYRTALGAIEIYLATSNTTAKQVPGVALNWHLLSSVTAPTSGTYPDYDPTFGAYTFGDIVSVQADVGPYYLSLVPTQTHKANDIARPSRWLKLLTSPTVIPPWVFGKFYPAGSLAIGTANIGGAKNVYVQRNIRGSSNDPGATSNVDWLLIPTLTDQGVYNGTANYGVGDYVSPAVTVPGRIHVEKYQPFDFLTLGIPTVLG